MSESIEQTLASLRAQPGINVTKLAVGTRLTVETTQAVYEMVITHPILAIVRLFSTDPRLREGVSGELIESSLDLNGSVALPRWIGKNLRMHFNFKNGIYSCTPALSARVVGSGFHYDVF